MMPDYNDGEWHFWSGGACPVHPSSVVEAVWHDSYHGTAGITGPRLAVEDPGPCMAWAHVVKFRVVTPYTPPREVWVVGQVIFPTAREAKTAFPNSDPVLMREVRE